MDYFFYSLLFFLSAVSTALATKGLLKHLQRHAIDIPNARSNHKAPTPRGGGIAIMIVILPLLSGFALYYNHLVLLPIIAACVLLSVFSFIDDIKSLSIKIRLFIQVIAVTIGLLFLPDGMIFQGMLPAWLDHTLTFLAWIWFINLYNFMDGIDGLAGSETFSIAIGIAVIATLTSLPYLTEYGFILAGAAAGFLLSNWHPAKLFMGDVGSITLGFLLGFFLLTLAREGHLAAALILPLYYLTDSSFTLIKRLCQKKKIWEAHSEHFYQQAVRNGWKHNRVVKRILGVNLVLIVLATLSTLGGFVMLGASGLALLIVGWLARSLIASTV